MPSNEPLAGTDGIGGPPWLFLLQVAVGLPFALWFYKVCLLLFFDPDFSFRELIPSGQNQCLLLVLLQRRIIYLPSVPPFTRSETLSPPSPERSSQLSGLNWDVIDINSPGKSRWTRTPIQLKALKMSGPKPTFPVSKSPETTGIVILYLQGNAGTPLLRIPLFRSLLLPSTSVPSNRDLTIIAPAPRSFWLSTRTPPTENGVMEDYKAALEYVHSTFPQKKIVLFGHSLGGAAALLLAKELETTNALSTEKSNVVGMILENPLPSIPYMVRSLYPQRWLPYHYLGPFAFDTWDAISASTAKNSSIKTLWIKSGKDEIISGDGVREMFERYGEDGGKTWILIENALHDTAWSDRRWKIAVHAFLDDVQQGNGTKSDGRTRI